MLWLSKVFGTGSKISDPEFLFSEGFGWFFSIGMFSNIFGTFFSEKISGKVVFPDSGFSFSDTLESVNVLNMSIELCGSFL